MSRRTRGDSNRVSECGIEPRDSNDRTPRRNIYVNIGRNSASAAMPKLPAITINRNWVSKRCCQIGAITGSACTALPALSESGPIKNAMKRLASRPVVTNKLKSDIEVAMRFVCTPASRAAYAPIVTPCTMNVMAIAPISFPDQRCGTAAAAALTLRSYAKRSPTRRPARRSSSRDLPRSTTRWRAPVSAVR